LIRVAYFGQKPIGERCWRRLRERHQSQLEVVAVVSNQSRDVWWRSNAIYEDARASGIRVLANDSREDEEVVRLLAESAPDVLLSVQHRWILPADALAAVETALNLHNAPLPGYKGFNTYTHALLNRESTYAATMHWMTPDVDEGAVALEEAFHVAPNETALSLYERANDAAEALFETVLEMLTGGDHIPRVRRDGTGTFYTRASADALREIADPDDAEEVDRKSRAFHFPPFEPAFLVAEGRKHHVVPGWVSDG
jgi:methionyl-tRNA formyltransferase